MNGKADIPSLERPTFFSGQRLMACDLSELQRAHRERVWLHNRAFHGWGIGIGLAVTGEAGDTLVRIDEGYAVDCLGREIILTEPRSLTVPAVAGGPSGDEALFCLVAAYRDDAEQQVAERRAGVCVPEETVRLTEEPRLEWLTEEQLQEQQGLAVVLAKARVKNCQLSRPLSLAERRSARGSRQPYIATGQTVRGATAWSEWRDGGSLLGVRTRVDTSAARFQATPHYFAHLVGERYLANRTDDVGTSFVIRAIPEVCDVAPSGFMFRVLVPTDSEAALAEGRIVSMVTSGLDWHVVWMGVEA